MSHYAIVKRQRYWIKPEWTMGEAEHSFKRIDKVKYEDLQTRLGDFYYVNLIKHEKTKGLLIDYWEGEIHHDTLEVKEKIVISGESLTIKNIEKNIDGSFIYEVDAIYEKVDNYDELLVECEKKYDEYSKQREIEAEEYERLKNEEIATRNNNVKQTKKKSWFERIFGK